MRLEEIFDKQVNYKVMLNTKNAAEAEFEIGGVTFNVYIRKEPINRLFDTDDVKKLDDEYFDIVAHGVGFSSNINDLQQNLGTKVVYVFTAIVDFIKKQISEMNIEYLAFCGEDDKLSSLYRKLIQRFAREYKLVYQSKRCFLLEI